MCGRFVKVDGKRRYYDSGMPMSSAPLPDVPTRPTDMVDVILTDGSFELMSWGFSFDWAKRPLINVRSETALEKSAFAPSVQHRRCLMTFESYFETDDRQVPWMFTVTGESCVKVAAIWKDGPNGREVAMLTCEPNGLVRSIHDRMPAILSEADSEVWLACEDAVLAMGLIQPFPAELMVATELPRDHFRQKKQQGLFDL